VLSGASQRWWERDPERLEQELAHIAEIAPVVDRSEEDGCLVLKISLPFGSEKLSVTILFRPGYPYFPPVLAAEPGTIDRHQNPNDGHFCLVDNEEHWWRPTFMAALLVKELQRLLEASVAGTVGEGELAMPEPVTGYLPEMGNVALVHGAMLGTDLATERGEFTLSEYRPNGYVVTSIDGVQPETIRLPKALAERLDLQGSSRSQRGTWSVAEPPPGPTDLTRLQEEAVRELAEIAGPMRKQAGRGRRNPVGTRLWTARTFLEEGPRRGELRRAWVFYLAVLDRKGSLDSLDLVTTQALDEAARAERLRELGGLRDVAFLLVGAGALGAPVAGELAKAGAIDLDIVDPSFYDLNNSVRHVLPFSRAGAPKASEVATWAESLNPFAAVRGHQFGIGREEPERLARLIEAADVIVDTTGLHVVTRHLHAECASRGKPLVTGALSLGGYGGRVLHLTGARPCFDCFLADPGIPLPLSAPRDGEMLTPYGCSHPAASCAGFDVVELAAGIARTAIRATNSTEYPSIDFDWAVVNFRPGSERWSQGTLAPFLDCEWCSR
jgi:molybdopterin/thiamine biosynthesis adenylyltransferase